MNPGWAGGAKALREDLLGRWAFGPLMEWERYEFDQPIYGGVNVLRIGDTLVDTGHVSDRCREAMEAHLAADLSDVERVLITHPHIDHVGGSQTIDALADLPHVVPAEADEIIHDYGAYIREVRADMTRLLQGFGVPEGIWDPYVPAREDYAGERIDIERVLTDGDTVDVGGYELEAVHTPGHSRQHHAYWHEPSGVCLSADIVSRNGHFMYGPLYADVGAYKESLERLADLEPDVLVPMHGDPAENPQATIEDCLEKAQTTDERLRSWLEEEEQFYARHFTRDEIGASKANAGFLTLVTYAFLEHLEERGECRVRVTEEGIEVTRTTTD